ncbi:MAG TPA: Clp protease N-terminal domain-containing protein [Jiangellaceae bacterium]
MFERFTQSARLVVVRGRDEAHRFGHSWVGAEHLLLGVLTQPDAPGVQALNELGVTLETAREALTQVVGLDVSDADALRAVGIDLDEVRHRVEATFGPGALDRPLGRRSRHRLFFRRARCEPSFRSGHLRFMPRAKRVLERSLREALNLGDRHIGVEHIVLGLLDPDGNTAIELLRHLEVNPDAVRAFVLDSLGKAA